MKRKDTEDKITAESIAGYATELTVWRFFYQIANTISNKPCRVSLKDVIIEGEEFVLSTSQTSNHADAVWFLGNSAYQLITGLKMFGGKGLEEMNADIRIPKISMEGVSMELSNLISQCLIGDEKMRCDVNYIIRITEKRINDMEKKVSTKSSLYTRKHIKATIVNDSVHFWKEAMVAVLLMLSFVSVDVMAQSNPELETLVTLTESMRNQKNRSSVISELMKDDKWTLMDELKYNKNECMYKDKVNMFGMNDIARDIKRKEKSIVKNGGRFVHSADGKHAYSYIEITVKAKSSVTYEVKGHKGVQHIVTVPFDKKQVYSVSGNGSRKVTATRDEKGLARMVVTPAANGSYTFEIKNEGKKNASFVVITYNSGK